MWPRFSVSRRWKALRWLLPSSVYSFALVVSLYFGNKADLEERERKRLITEDFIFPFLLMNTILLYAFKNYECALHTSKKKKKVLGFSCLVSSFWAVILYSSQVFKLFSSTKTAIKHTKWNLRYSYDHESRIWGFKKKVLQLQILETTVSLYTMDYTRVEKNTNSFIL